MASSFSCLPDLFRLPVIILKRLWAGDMTQDRIAAEMQAARPGIILLQRYLRAALSGVAGRGTPLAI